MYQNQISNLPKLKDQNFENIFTVHTDENDFYYYNLLQTVQFPSNLPDIFFVEHTVKPNEPWTLISYKYYNTIKLWWIIAFANNVINPINSLQVGDIIKIPKPSVVKDILTQIQLSKK